MITIITGVPGSGKTALCVDLITREYKDRIIFNPFCAALKLINRSKFLSLLFEVQLDEYSTINIIE